MNATKTSNSPRREVPVTVIYAKGLQYGESKKIIESLDERSGGAYEGHQVNSLRSRGVRGLYKGAYFHTDMKAERETRIRAAQNGMVLDGGGSFLHFITAIKRRLGRRKIPYEIFEGDIPQGELFGRRMPNLEKVIDKISRDNNDLDDRAYKRVVVLNVD